MKGFQLNYLIGCVRGDVAHLFSATVQRVGALSDLEDELHRAFRFMDRFSEHLQIALELALDAVLKSESHQAAQPVAREHVP